MRLRSAFVILLSFFSVVVWPLSAAPPPRPDLRGFVYKGREGFAGARIYILAAAVNQGQGDASVSLVNPEMGRLDTSSGPTHGYRYVLADNNGRFMMFNAYTCVPGQQVYLYISGEPNPEDESAASSESELATLGNCPERGNFGSVYPRIVVNEVTTIAAAYSLARYARDAMHISYDGSLKQQESIREAFASAAKLVDVRTGEATAGADLSPGEFPPQTLMLHALANVLNACISLVSLTDPVPGPCVDLFRATAGNTSAQHAPVDTASAAINIALHPAANVDALFLLSRQSSAFSPALTAKPKDFVLRN